jgi:hypothetical protein
VTFLVIYMTLWKTMPATVHRTVQVYLSVQSDGGGNILDLVKSFSIRYRRPTGPIDVPGNDGHVSLQDTPWEAKEILVERVNCVGYITKKQQQGEPSPWIYPIKLEGDGGAVNIDMVKSKPQEDPRPTGLQVLEIIEKHGLKQEAIRRPGPNDKHEVSLKIENATDRPITFLAYDCIAALDGTFDAQEAKLWSGYKDIRLQPGENKTWPNFDNFGKPSGWFALFVRYEDHQASRIVQKPLGVYNLFKIREPGSIPEKWRLLSGLDSIASDLSVTQHP